ncbi:hypothetical protein HanPI659440_Chr08g0308691 [Helianthus annuus]|nr:hypothetical protein HanPI659440_Chr08g0308691 [Helianthus annuus]
MVKTDDGRIYEHLAIPRKLLRRLGDLSTRIHTHHRKQYPNVLKLIKTIVYSFN